MEDLICPFVKNELVDVWKALEEKINHIPQEK